jgi:hypothetical protein
MEKVSPIISKFIDVVVKVAKYQKTIPNTRGTFK